MNHKPEVAEPHKEHQPQGLLVIPNENATGEDDPIFSQRLERDGWELKIPWRVEYLGYLGYHTVQTEVRERVNADRTYVLRLTRSIEGFHDVEKFTIRGMKQSVETQVDRVGWMDWDQQGRLVFTRDGKIFAGALKNDGQLTEEELVDLNPSSPQPLPAPEWATKW